MEKGNWSEILFKEEDFDKNIQKVNIENNNEVEHLEIKEIKEEKEKKEEKEENNNEEKHLEIKK